MTQDDSGLHISELWVYPIKSCQGRKLEQATLVPTGIQHDREWMVARPDGLFLSQRVLPKMAQIQPRVTDDALVVDAPRMPQLEVPIVRRDRQRVVGTVWKNEMPAWDEGPEAAAWFTAFLGRECRLLRSMGERVVDKKFQMANASKTVHAADGFPLLVTSTATLESLAGPIDETQRDTPAIPMNRFRPNVVVSADQNLSPGQEDHWRTLLIGETKLHLVKACSRCPIPNIDQVTGERLGDVEPILRQQRLGLRVGKTGPLETYFGQLAVHQAEPGACRRCRFGIGG